MGYINAAIRFGPAIAKGLKIAAPWVVPPVIAGGAAARIDGVRETLGLDADSVAKGVDYDLNETMASQTAKKNLGDHLRWLTTGVTKEAVAKEAKTDAVDQFEGLLDKNGLRQLQAAQREYGATIPGNLDLVYNDGDNTKDILANLESAKSYMEVIKNLPPGITASEVAGMTIPQISAYVSKTDPDSPANVNQENRDRVARQEAESIRQQRWQEWNTEENRRERAHETEMANKLAMGKLGLEEGKMMFEFEDRRLDREDRRRADQRDRIAELISGLTQLGAGMAL